MGKRRALITGITGQDGSYLAEHLLIRDYEVFGTIRRKAVQEEELGNVKHLENEINFEYADVTDSASIRSAIEASNPHEVYNLAGQSQVRISFDMPTYTMQVNAMGALNVLEACRAHNKNIRFYQASTSEMFGSSHEDDKSQNEYTPMQPVSPYGSAKLFAHNMVQNYRKAYKMFATSGILFNHESPRRGSAFVTQKIVQGAVSIAMGNSETLELGNLKVARDWGHAKDYVKAMWLMLQHERPDDFVIATGEPHYLEDFITHVFKRLQLDPKKHIVQNPKLVRPNEIWYLKGDPTKAFNELRWRPMYTFEEMVDEMLIAAWDETGSPRLASWPIEVIA